MIKGTLPLNATKPDCAALSQPSIPASCRAQLQSPASSTVTLSWTPAVTHDGDRIAFYEITLAPIGDTTFAEIYATPGAECAVAGVPRAAASTGWRVRAVNGKGVRGGWSLAAGA